MTRRAVFFGVIFTCVALALDRPFSLAAEPVATEASRDKADGKPKTRRKPLPANYGMIGLDDSQRDQIYAVMDSYEGRLDKLRKEMESLTEERNQKMDVFLTTAQKARLLELRSAKSADTEKAKPGKEKPKQDKAS